MGTTGSDALADLLLDLVASRSDCTTMILEISRQVRHSEKLISALRDTLAAGEGNALSPSPPPNRMFRPEIVGDGKVGWTDGTANRVCALARAAISDFTQQSHPIAQDSASASSPSVAEPKAEAFFWKPVAYCILGALSVVLTACGYIVGKAAFADSWRLIGGSDRVGSTPDLTALLFVVAGVTGVFALTSATRLYDDRRFQGKAKTVGVTAIILGTVSLGSLICFFLPGLLVFLVLGATCGIIGVLWEKITPASWRSRGERRRGSEVGWQKSCRKCGILLMPGITMAFRCHGCNAIMCQSCLEDAVRASRGRVACPFCGGVVEGTAQY